MAQMVKIPSAMQETWVPFLGPEDLLEEGVATHPVFLPGESHGQRSPAGYSPQDRKESDTAKATEHARTHTHSTVSGRAGIQGQALQVRRRTSRTHDCVIGLYSVT